MKQRWRQFRTLGAGICMTFVAAGHAVAFEIDHGEGGSVLIPVEPVIIQKRTVKQLPPVLLAQSPADNAFRVDSLQEQVRKLNGKVEELTFQLLQLQEQLRKMQEDNEFRFQELEDKRSDAGDAVRSGSPATASGGGDKRLGKPQPSEDMPKGNSSGGDTLAQTAKALGLPPRNLGTLRFDAAGNIIESAVGKPLDLTRPVDPSSSPFNGDNGVDVANLEPGLLLAKGRDYFDNGDYELAEKNLRAFTINYPEDKNRAEVQFWLGRSLFAKGDFHGAATTFLDTHNAYPDARRAPETLLWLGLSMAGLNNRDIACATYAEVLKQFPNADDRVKTQVANERASARC